KIAACSKSAKARAKATSACACDVIGCADSSIGVYLCFELLDLLSQVRNCVHVGDDGLGDCVLFHLLPGCAVGCWPAYVLELRQAEAVVEQARSIVGAA